MKVCKYPDGRIRGKTMTVSELREKLLEYPDDMPVFGEWEGVHGYVNSFQIEKVNKAGEDSLVMWVEEY